MESAWNGLLQAGHPQAVQDLRIRLKDIENMNKLKTADWCFEEPGVEILKRLRLLQQGKN